MTTDTEALVQETLGRLTVLPLHRQWAACAAVWARLWALATPGWPRWPGAAERVLAAMSVAFARMGNVPAPSSDLALVGLEALDMEDDGTAEFQSALDLASLLIQALADLDASRCLEVTIRTYLEGTFNVLANEHADRTGRSVTHAVALVEVGNSSDWHDAVRLVRSL